MAWVDILKGSPMWLSSQHINHVLMWSWLTWVRNFSKSKRNLWQHGSCDFGTHSSIYVGDELEWLASTATHRLLRQRLPNTRWLTQGAPNQMLTLMEWINAAIHMVGSNMGELQILWVNGLPMQSWPKWWENWAWSSQYLTQTLRAQMTSASAGGVEDALLTTATSASIPGCCACTPCAAPHLGGDLCGG